MKKIDKELSKIGIDNVTGVFAYKADVGECIFINKMNENERKVYNQPLSAFIKQSDLSNAEFIMVSNLDGTIEIIKNRFGTIGKFKPVISKERIKK